MSPSDEELFVAWRRTRAPHLLAQVFDRAAEEVLRVAAYLCGGDHALVEDALQATFLAAMTDADSFDPARRLRPWLLGILTNHVRRARRQRRRAAGAGDDALAAASVGDAAGAAA